MKTTQLQNETTTMNSREEIDVELQDKKLKAYCAEILTKEAKKI